MVAGTSTSFLRPIKRTQFDKILLTVLNISPILIIEHLFGYRYRKRGIKMLRKNEEELFNIIRENDNPEQAVMTAIMVFAAFLEQPEAVPTPPVAVLLESV